MGSARGKSLERSPAHVERARASSLYDQASPLDPLLELQQTVGNQAVLRLLRAGYAQAKFRHPSPGAASFQGGGGYAAPRARSGPPLTLQKKCARCATGATCSECGEEEKLHRKAANQSSQPATGMIQRAAKLPTDIPATLSDNNTEAQRPARKCAECATGTTCKECGKKEKAPNLPVEPRARPAPDVGERTERLGSAKCDLDKGTVVWEIKKDKIPECMWECAEAHELAHVKFGHGECSKLSGLYGKQQELIARADKIRPKVKAGAPKAVLDEAEDITKKLKQASEDFRKAVDTYKGWLKRTCRDDEAQAYQADIDACTGPKVEKRCADSKETDRYKKMMKTAEKFKKNPPNCK